MAVYLVTWNLNGEKYSYSASRHALIKNLDSLETIKDDGLESVRFVSSNNTPDQLDAFLRQTLDNNDRLVVSRMRHGEHQGWLSPEVWKWISERL